MKEQRATPKTPKREKQKKKNIIVVED